MEQEKRYTDTCPFCGGQVILGDADCAAEVCSCSGAQHERGKKMKFEKLRAAIESICGEGCEKLYPIHKPLKEEQFAAVMQIAGMVAEQLIHTASLMLADGTSLKITPAKVERKASSQHNETI